MLETMSQFEPGNEPETYEITRVEQKVKNPRKYDLYFNGEYALTVHEDTVVALRLLKGSRLTSDDVRAIEREEHIRRALNQALRWIARRAHAAKEIERKLRQHEMDETTIETVMRRLAEQKLIDDRLFAIQWAQHRIRQQAKGRHFVRYELMQKGVAKADIEAALGDVDGEEELEHALQLARKKWRQTKGEPLARKHKTAAYLMRRGFPSEIVKRAVRECAAEVDSDEDGLFDV
jgi:regulatory protein